MLPTARLIALAALGSLWTLQAWANASPGTDAAQREASRLAAAPPVHPPLGRQIRVDHSGRRQVGEASVYSPRFERRRMANGERFHRRDAVAASRSLPLGTTARVTNLETRQSAIVRIRDRGPFVSGRITDLSPAVAERIGIDKRHGTALVEVAPIAVPQPDGSSKAGAGAAK